MARIAHTKLNGPVPKPVLLLPRASGFLDKLWSVGQALNTFKGWITIVGAIVTGLWACSGLFTRVDNLEAGQVRIERGQERVETAIGVLQGIVLRDRVPIETASTPVLTPKIEARVKRVTTKPVAETPWWQFPALAGPKQ